uniref:Agamous-like MADS-box protein AGL80 n=2 Tax=Cicer arietinum TaxID=3827 RepID=A0A3Q7YAY2_CICAR|nr:agamous-like MADS-box protein AGL80 [Cicer arietinum]
MARKKVKLAYITCHSKRRETFKKRKNGLIKKVSEISTLCGIEACAIIYDKNNTQVEVWPSESEIKSVLSRFMSFPEMERSKKMLDQEGFLRQTIAKVYEQLKKQIEETRKKEMTNLIGQYIHTGEFNGYLMSKNDLNDFSSFIDESLKTIEQKMSQMAIIGEEDIGNGVQSMNAIEGQENIGHALLRLVSGGEDQQENMGHVAQGLETNICEDLQINYGQWPMDFPMLPFSYDSVDPNGF